MLEKVVRKHVLKNALEYGKAQGGSVVGKVIAEHPEAKKDMKRTMSLIQKTVQEVNGLSKKQIEKELAGYSFVEKKPVDKKLELPEVKGEVITRFSPEPNGYAHIGHAKAAFLGFEAASTYKGRCILRWDDTNPETEKKQFVEAIGSDLQWLGLEFDAEYYSSDLMPLFYRYADQLVKQRDAFVCSCKKEEMAKNREEKKMCRCREAENVSWEDIKQGKVAKGEAVLRLKGDTASLNTVMRDPTLFRIVKARHYRQKDKYKAWPNYDFAVCIADSHQGVTHALRSKEYELRDELYYTILDKLHLRKPLVYDFSRLNLQGTKPSKRFLLPLIKAKKVAGWDDPRLPTLAGLRRRGILPQAIKNFVLSFGLSKVESNPSWDKLLAENRKLLEATAKHFFFVTDPVKFKIVGIAPGHSREQAASHNFVDLQDANYVYIPKKEASPGTELRLKGFCSVRLNGKDAEIIEAMPEKKVEWTFVSNSVKTKLIVVGELFKGNEFNTDSLRIVSGVCPKSALSLTEGESVQFERIGFVRLDKKTRNPVFILTC
ncbi:glutamate--tRNA ligase [Candidatus Micrarchaeota archaeon]|nr:glutamate--tRNA ligase [Candidatus Micrarchaeota archaeon]